MELPFTIEGDLEKRIAADPDWQQGAQWGEPRPGHSEGQVMFHIADVLTNIEKRATSPEERVKLRLIALIHDTFKFMVDQTKPKVGSNHHAVIARRFAERYLTDPALLEIIELHDEAYNSWSAGQRKNDWAKAENRAQKLVERLGEALVLYVRFYRTDNQTDGKDQTPLLWFEQFLKQQSKL